MLCLPSGGPNTKFRGRGRLRNFRKRSWATRAKGDSDEPSDDDYRPGFNLHMFPHICENIYDSTPLPRENLRLVSKGFKELVDKDITWHMGVTTPHSREALERASLPPQKAYELHSDTPGCKDYHYCHCAPLFFQVGLTAKYATTRMIPDGRFVGGADSHNFQSTRVLDLVLPPVFAEWSLPSLPARVSILRLIPARFGLPSYCSSRASRAVKAADTVVTFTRPREQTFANQPYFGHFFLQRRTVVNVGIPCPPELISGTHCDWPPRHGDPLHIHWQDNAILDRLEECVYIFDDDWHNWPGATQSNIKLLSASDYEIEWFKQLDPVTQELEATTDHLVDFPNTRFNSCMLARVIYTFTLALGTSQDPVRLVFVGAASLSAALDLDKPFQYESFIKDRQTQAAIEVPHYALVQRRLRAAILWRSSVMGPYFSDKWVSHEEMLHRVHHLVEFRTHEEHRAKVGDYQYRAETVGYEWLGIGEPEEKSQNV